MEDIDQARHRVLVVRCQLGERRAFEDLYLRHNRALGYYVRRMLNRHDVEDVQQEVWLTVLRKISQLRHPEAFVVWLYRIARSQISAKLWDPQTPVPLNGDVAEKQLYDDELEFSADDAARIHAELGQLSAKHREVLVLRFLENLSYEQIADVIGCTPGTVRSRLHYAKSALRERLEESHGGVPERRPAPAGRRADTRS